MELSQELLQDRFEYKDGVLYWKKVNSNTIKVGDLAGTVGLDTRRKIKFFNKIYIASRLIFLYHKGYLPEKVDHINRDCTDDRISNLREVTHSQNMFNKTSHKNSSSKFKGVSFRKSSKKWRVRVDANGVQKHVGYFSTEIEAAMAYNKMATELHGEYANLNLV